MTLFRGNPQSRSGGKARSGAAQLVRTAEVAAGAFGTAALSARRGGAGGAQIFGMPIELILAVGFYGVGMFGVAGEFSDDLSNFGDGALGAYLATEGRKVGLRGRVSASGQIEETDYASVEDILEGRID